MQSPTIPTPQTTQTSPSHSHYHDTKHLHAPWHAATIGIGVIMTMVMILYVYSYTTTILYRPQNNVLTNRNSYEASLADTQEGSVIGAQTEAETQQPSLDAGEISLPRHETRVRVSFEKPFETKPVVTITAVLPEGTSSAILVDTTRVGISEVSIEGFTLVRVKSLPLDTTYTWSALAR